MAYYWTIVPTGTASRLTGLGPDKFKREVFEIARENDLLLEELLFDDDGDEHGPIAFALLRRPNGRAGDIDGFVRDVDGTGRAAPRNLRAYYEKEPGWRSGDVTGS